MIGLLIVVTMIPLYLWIGRIDEEARRRKVPSFEYICGAFAGWMAAVTVLLFSAQILFHAVDHVAVLPEEVYAVGWILIGLFGGGIGGGVSYLILRATNARDPDYGEAPARRPPHEGD